MNPCRFDCHVHSSYSPDGSDDIAAFAARIDEGVADGIGFAEHYDFLPECGAWNTLDEAAYLAEIRLWKARGYAFFAGVEVDFVGRELPAIRDSLQKYRFDFVIGSVHTLPSGGVSDRDISHWDIPGVFDRMLDEYRAEFLASLAVAEIDVIGHPGVFQRYLTPEFLDQLARGRPGTIRSDRIRELESELAAAAARSGKLIEVNSSGFFAPLGTSCASPFFLSQFKSHGGQRITLSSDAHRALDLRRGMDQARSMLQGLGFNEVWLPWDKSNPIALSDYLGPRPIGSRT